VVDPMAEYNMPQYILREFKVTDARVISLIGSVIAQSSKDDDYLTCAPVMSFGLCDTMNEHVYLLSLLVS